MVGLQRAARLVFDLVYPPSCVLCGAEVEPTGFNATFCTPCRGLLAAQQVARCERCGARIPEWVATPAVEPPLPCSECRRRKLPLERVVTLGAYSGPLRTAVLRMKKLSEESLSVAMADLLWQEERPAIERCAVDVVVPIAMHWLRRVRRGTHSAETVAVRLARQMRVPVATRMLLRRRNTLPQAGLSRRQRALNMRGAFAVRAGYDLTDARVLLVDDIMTSGATCSEAARALRRAGATSISVAVVARADVPD